MALAREGLLVVTESLVVMEDLIAAWNLAVGAVSEATGLESDLHSVMDVWEGLCSSASVKVLTETMSMTWQGGMAVAMAWEGLLVRISLVMA